MYLWTIDVEYTPGVFRFFILVVEEFLLYSDDKFIKGKVLSNVSQAYTAAILPVTTSNAGSAGLDFDARDNYIYYSDVSQNVIYRIFRNGTGKRLNNFFILDVAEIYKLTRFVVNAPQFCTRRIAL